MKIESSIGNSIFQLNILIWMAKSQPQDDYYIKPFFYENGFEIKFIEAPRPIPEQVVQIIDSLNLDISKLPTPELIIGRDRDQKALYFEAKSDSFGISSTNSRQARGHLIVTGPSFSVSHAPLSTCLLCYLTPNEKKQAMMKTLTELAEELNSNGLQTGRFSTHGLDFKSGDLIYRWDDSFKAFIEIDDDHVILKSGLAEETDFLPMVLVYTDSDCSNSEDRDIFNEVILEKMRTLLLTDLHHLGIGIDYKASPEYILNKTSDGLFSLIGSSSRKQLKKFVKDNFYGTIKTRWRDTVSGVSFVNNILSIKWFNIEQKEAFLDWLEDRRTQFRCIQSKEEESGLFIDLEDSGNAHV